MRIFLKAGDDVVDSLLAVGEGGGMLRRGLRELVQEAYDGAFRVEFEHEGCPPCSVLRSELQTVLPGAPRLSAGPPTRIVAAQPDVVVLSLAADTSSPVDEYREAMHEVVTLLQRHADAHVIVFNCTSFDPLDRASNYHRTGDTLPWRIHRLNRALIELSVSDGLSIVDVDRIVAEHGAESHVPSALRFSETICDAVAREFLRILDDYGFFEARPLVAQVGRQVPT